ncbi:6768_t:CDS:2 [Acaulospora colombiana]|uniref:6768_t:CDS:1 n=1 Tax=Acaulospora colombiana TaxID=27376 RepID=A0ACA9M5S9_9GLOM|nr:6768_t:CDS:2 [Acaulospora colombiana]
MPKSLDSLSSASSKYSSRKFRSERSRTPVRRSLNLSSCARSALSAKFNGNNTFQKFKTYNAINKFAKLNEPNTYYRENNIETSNNCKIIPPEDKSGGKFTSPLTIPQAKKAGLIDDIRSPETKLKLISLFQENNNYINLTEIPAYYFSRYHRALEYFGKFKYAMVNELPGILTQITINSVIIIRLAEPFQLPNTDVLPVEFTITKTNEDEFNNCKNEIIQDFRCHERVLGWLKGQGDGNEIDNEERRDISEPVSGEENVRESDITGIHELEKLVEQRMKELNFYKEEGNCKELDFQALRKKLIAEISSTQ